MVAKTARQAKKVRIDPAQRHAARASSPQRAFDEARVGHREAGDPAKQPKKVDILDRSKDFAEIHPPGSFHGAFYCQNFKYYDQDGHRISVPGEAEILRMEEEGRNRKSKYDRRDAPPRDGIAAEPTDYSIPEVSVDDVHLTAWGQGDVDYRFPQVREAIRGRYGVLVTTMQGALDTLEAEGVISGSERRDRKR